MKKITKLFTSFLTIFAISVCTVTSASAATESSSFTYTFKPKSTVYNTTTSAVYSDPVDYGRKSQTGDFVLYFSVNIPPKTSRFYITVRCELQKENGSSWSTVKTVDLVGDFINTNTTGYSYKTVKKNDVTYYLTKGSTYRVKYTVIKNTASAKYNLMPTTEMTFNLE